MTTFVTDQATIYQHPDLLLQKLIRFNTTNPPGNEVECIRYLDKLLTGAGIQTQILARDPGRPNLIARLKGQGNASPLLIYGHVDVVSTDNQEWQQPPFGGDLVDGYIWGRGTLDMKGGVAMMVAAVLRSKIEGKIPPGDVMLAVVSDEESGGTFGAKFLVEEHAGLFEGIHYAVGEFGGCAFYVGEKKFYPIMVSEKLPCMIEASIVGRSGYPSLAIRGGAMAKLAKVLQIIDRKSTPIHVTEIARQSLEALARNLSFPSNIFLRQLLNPKLSNRVLRSLGIQGEVFEPMLHNTVNATAIKGADKYFVLPERIVINLACLLLPGYGPNDMITELHQMLGDDIDLKVIFVDGKVPAIPDMGLFGILQRTIRDVDPEGIPLPVLMPIPTDGRTFSQLGIQTYGFIPMSLPRNFNFWQTIHAANERIPVEALTFGTDAIYQVMQRF